MLQTNAAAGLTADCFLNPLPCLFIELSCQMISALLSSILCFHPYHSVSLPFTNLLSTSLSPSPISSLHHFYTYPTPIFFVLLFLPPPPLSVHMSLLITSLPSPLSTPCSSYIHIIPVSSLPLLYLLITLSPPSPVSSLHPSLVIPPHSY